MIFDIICTAPGVTPPEIRRKAAAKWPRFLRFALRPWCAVVLWHLESDGDIMHVECECGWRHYYPADGGRMTDHRVWGR